ncbi:MAG: DUF4375 domain-containing protein [Clostridia bacterium]
MKNNLHQRIMNRVYKMWQKNDEWTSAEFFDRLNYQERIAVALGNLNYQVQNGGFSQWKFNSYAKNHLSFLLRLEVDKKEYPDLAEALSLVSKFKTFDEENGNDKGYDDEDDGFANEELEKCLDLLDTRYYELKNLEDEMNKFIEGVKS